jgi:hypothetical protein
MFKKINKLAVLILISFLFFQACKIAEISSSDSSTNESNNVDNSDNSIRIEPNESQPTPNSPSTSDQNNPSCATNANTIDGPGGFLWKPNSESDNNLVVLFAASYDLQFQSVEALRVDGGIDAGTFSGFANGGRQHFRFPSPGSAYTGQLTVANPQGDTLEECTWIVSNPEVRND